LHSFERLLTSYETRKNPQLFCIKSISTAKLDFFNVAHAKRNQYDVSLLSRNENKFFAENLLYIVEKFYACFLRTNGCSTRGPNRKSLDVFLQPLMNR
jgi:hypothetical protein